jgi:tryptophanyl-tRNA synthetase
VKRVLTGITTSGTPHIGNYVGAIRPAIAASRRADVESFYFLADLHALIKTGDPARVARSTLEIAATWLALGLDPARVFFYRQSDIPEIPELTWFLTCVTPKGLLNRAHAYKAATDANREASEDADAGITAGLYMYPVLMAADILVFNAHSVPVGRDQIQHIEIARDIGQRFNHLYGREYFTLPEAQVDEATAILPGLDGRKMSKSYDNVIPLWDEPAALERKIMGIVTNSQPPGEPKNPDDSALYTIWQAFATPEECADMRRRYAEGIAWGEAKKLLAARIDAELSQARTEYRRLIADPSHIEAVLRAGAERARARVAPFLAELRAAVGLRSMRDFATADAGAGAASKKKAAGPRWLTFRERDGRFNAKLVGADGAVLAQGLGFATPDAARGLHDALLDVDPLVLERDALVVAPCEGGYRFTVHLPADTPVMHGPVVPTEDECRMAYARFEAARAALAAART